MKVLPSLLGVFLLIAAWTSPVQAQSTDTGKAVLGCVSCHKAVYDNISQSKHGVSADGRTPAQCETCHGDTSKHTQDPSQLPSLTFGKNSTLSADEKNAVCNTCHKGGNRMRWPGSTHERTETTCSDCHKTHAAKDPVTVKAVQASVCYSCHKEVRSATMQVSAHPIKTGQMSCSECHQPHGSVSDFLLIKNNINETCYTCHADKRGPNLWEHPPVRESCMNCHAPHGSNTRPMLSARPPYLCQQCHPAVHTSFYDGNSLPGGSGGSPERMQAGSCMNCHNAVHGGNHPSSNKFRR